MSDAWTSLSVEERVAVAYARVPLEDDVREPVISYRALPNRMRNATSLDIDRHSTSQEVGEARRGMLVVGEREDVYRSCSYGSDIST